MGGYSVKNSSQWFIFRFWCRNWLVWQWFTQLCCSKDFSTVSCYLNLNHKNDPTKFSVNVNRLKFNFIKIIWWIPIEYITRTEVQTYFMTNSSEWFPILIIVFIFVRRLFLFNHSEKIFFNFYLWIPSNLSHSYLMIHWFQP